MELSNEDSLAETGYVSVKMTITQLATKLNVSMQYLTDLLTTDKTIIGAINELNDKLTIGTSAPTSLMGNDGDFYLQYTEGTGGADDEVDAFYVKLDGVWCQVSTGGGGSGGHTILDNSGTALTQRTNLQFKGAYSEDNSGDDTTEVNVVRSMTKAQYDQLSAAEKVGIINVTDEKVTATNIPISANDSTDTKMYIDSKTTATTPTITVTKNSGAWGFSNVTAKKYGGVVNLSLRITGSNTAVASGSDGFSGSIDTLRPNSETYTITYYGSNLFVIRLTATGDLYVRNVNSSSFTLPTTDWLNVSLTYLV